jgi:hydroxyacylglutathione hydrolase
VSCEILTLLIPPDNYCYLLISGNEAAVIDPPEAPKVSYEIEKRNLDLKFIFSTHFHSDHTGGNGELKAKYRCIIAGCDRRIPQIDNVLGDGAIVGDENISIRVLSVPGHTKDQAAYYLKSNHALFTGDTLFCAGCGRIFEGGPDQLYSSLQKLASLPDETLIYPGHDYTMENLRFALIVEPDNREIDKRIQSETKARSAGIVTVPSNLLLEKKTNPFLRCDSKSIRRELGMMERSPVAVFTELRKRKDVF